MIKSFNSKETQKIFNREFSRDLPNFIQKNALRKLWMLDAAISIDDLHIPPANHLEKLKGKQKNLYSIRINNQWRICFQWQKGDAYNVEIKDYH